MRKNIDKLYQTRYWERPKASMKEITHFINGEYVPSADGRTFEDRHPGDGKPIALVHEAGQAEVDQAVAAARAALEGEWGRMSQARRSELLNRVAARINERFEDF